MEGKALRNSRYLPALVDKLDWKGHVGLHPRRQIETRANPVLPSWHPPKHTRVNLKITVVDLGVASLMSTLRMQHVFVLNIEV